VDSLANDPGERFSDSLTNPPFGKKSTIAVVNEVGDLENEEQAIELRPAREDVAEGTQSLRDRRPRQRAFRGRSGRVVASLHLMGDNYRVDSSIRSPSGGC